jgi:hypothetical protein
VRIKSISLALAFGMIVCGSSVRAESTKGKFGVGGFAGAAIPTGDRTVKDNGKTDLGLEGFVRYGITDHWSAAVGLAVILDRAVPRGDRRARETADAELYLRAFRADRRSADDHAKRQCQTDGLDSHSVHLCFI